MNAPQLQKTKESIYDILGTIRRHPEMFLGERSISRLDSFLVGYKCGLGSLGFTFRAERPDFQFFHDWTAGRLGFSSSTTGWRSMILEKSAGEEEALERFFLLVDEFRRGQT